MNCEFIQNLMKYCFKLEKDGWPYAEIILFADGSGHITYKDVDVFTWGTTESWEKDNQNLLNKMSA